MEVPISALQPPLDDLLKRAEAGEEVIFTRARKATARLVPVTQIVSKERKRQLLEALRGSGKRDFGPDAARSQDWLYDDNGLPA
jgi:antitoxin (DNA-binding transcriptional repressor) of toxin-antitoxin stability system